MDSPELRASTPALEPESLVAAFHETYRRLGVTASRTCQTTAQVLAIAELLVSKGIISAEELDQVRKHAESRESVGYREAGLKVHVGHEVDKYATDCQPVEIDCESRLHLCRAACCRLRFPLTEQDITEGVVQWELSQPYLNRQRADGYCVHCDGESRRCQVYRQRPTVCRKYDCREDRRIWLDFHARTINPELFAVADRSTSA